uniref:ABC transporter domain-containing protein n=1 Tax=Seriola lalandi dorsalis TaxID=1841481 RepID=A0A3B4WL85_SERLL
KGNLTEVAKRDAPELLSYFELKMTNITFTYPAAERAQLTGVTVRVSLSTRAACIGANGAGKSTMIKLLTGELEPDAGSGEVWRHPNCRVAYVAQHQADDRIFVESHLKDVGLEPEFGTHTRMGALSGGQKVKVVLAGSMWNTPHIVILDEPTNYLDRDSLGALAEAIREYDGGVVIISHNAQFVDQVCPEVWHLENHTLNLKGGAQEDQEGDRREAQG